MSNQFSATMNINHLKSDKDLIKLGKHNFRKYNNFYDNEILEKDDNFSSYINSNLTEHNELLIGTDNIYNDVKKMYEDLFQESVDIYNANQQRYDRRIFDYFQKISDSKKENIATSIILQFNDKEYWEQVSNIEEKKEKARPMLMEQLKIFKEIFPDLKIANATIHWDESSPHMNLICVGVGYSKKNGLKVKSSLKQAIGDGKQNLAIKEERFISKSFDKYLELIDDKAERKEKGEWRKRLSDREYKKFKEDEIKTKALFVENRKKEITESKEKVIEKLSPIQEKINVSLKKKIFGVKFTQEELLNFNDCVNLLLNDDIQETINFAQDLKNNEDLKIEMNEKFKKETKKYDDLEIHLNKEKKKTNEKMEKYIESQKIFSSLEDEIEYNRIQALNDFNERMEFLKEEREREEEELTKTKKENEKLKIENKEIIEKVDFYNQNKDVVTSIEKNIQEKSEEEKRLNSSLKEKSEKERELTKENIELEKKSNYLKNKIEMQEDIIDNESHEYKIKEKEKIDKYLKKYKENIYLEIDKIDDLLNEKEHQLNKTYDLLDENKEKLEEMYDFIKNKQDYQNKLKDYEDIFKSLDLLDEFNNLNLSEIKGNLRTRRNNAIYTVIDYETHEIGSILTNNHQYHFGARNNNQLKTNSIIKSKMNDEIYNILKKYNYKINNNKELEKTRTMKSKMLQIDTSKGIER